MELLKTLSKIYEIVVFTAAQKSYADSILNLLDPENKYISYRLYRDSCINRGSKHIKDLRILRNRDLKRTVIVDNSIVSFANNLENGVHVPTYYGQPDDQCLKDIMKLLMNLSNSDDLQEELRKQVGLKEDYEQYKEFSE